MRQSIVTLIVICMMSAFSVAHADRIATVVAVQGAPKVTGPNGNRDLAANSAVFEKDKIIVTSGNAQILFVDGTKLVVGPGSSLVIEKYLMRGGSTAQKLSINALRGTFRFITGKSPKSAYNIKTANATIGIRGTGFDFWVKAKTGVAVLDGKVKLCNSSTPKSKGCVDLNAGCEVGLAQPGKAELLRGFVKGNNLVSNLPYILDQASLNSKFRLDTSGCEKALRMVKRDPRSGETQQERQREND
jgi:hypothetical protein